MQRGKEEKPRRVGDSVAVGGFSHLDGCLLLRVHQEPSSALPPPDGVRGCCQEELAEQAAATPAFLWPMDRSGPGSPGRGAPLLHRAPQLTLGFLHQLLRQRPAPLGREQLQRCLAILISSGVAMGRRVMSLTHTHTQKKPH